MFTERELMAAFRQEQHQKLRREAGKLDQIALLSRCVRELAEPDTELCMQLSLIHISSRSNTPICSRLPTAAKCPWP